ncbi:MAG: septum formation initiator family protein [Acidobacteriaceae bacterium]
MRRVSEAAYRVRRRIATGLAVVLAVFLAYHVVFGRNGVNNYEQKRAQDRQLHQQIDSMQQENSGLKSHVGRLKSDPDAIEYEAREKLHYARPGEVIYTLNQPQGAGGKTPSSAGPSGGGSNQDSSTH